MNEKEEAVLSLNLDVSEKKINRWPMAKLGDLATYINGRAFKPEEWSEVGLPIIRIQNLNEESASFNFYSGEFDERHFINDGDLLVSWSASLDAFIWDRGGAILNQHIFKVVEKSSCVDRHYLYYALREVMEEIRKQTHGATMKHINKPEFEAFEIPLPPIPEQQRIAQLLKTKLAAVERARQASEARLAAARELSAAYLREVFESEEADKWEIKRVEDISDLVVDGPHKTPNYQPNGVPFVTVRNIASRQLNLQDLNYISMHDYEEFCKRGKPERGDILYSKDGTLGIPCVVDTDQDFGFFVSVALIKPKRSVVISEYLAFALDSSRVLKQVETLGAGAGLKHMVLRSIKSLEVPLPSMKRQMEIASYLAVQKKRINEINISLCDEFSALNAMSTSFLRQAFSGAL